MAKQRTMSMTGAREQGFVVMGFRGYTAFMQNAFGVKVEAEMEIINHFEPTAVQYAEVRLSRNTSPAVIVGGTREKCGKKEDRHFMSRSGGRKVRKWHDRRDILY